MSGLRHCSGLALAWAVVLSGAAQLQAAEKLLTSAKEVRALTEEQAGAGLPVHLQGTYMGAADPEGIAFVIHDSVEGIYVQAPPELVRGLEQGDLLELEGFTNPGGYAPYVVAETLRKVGHGPIPAPIKATLEELYAGQMDAQWVEIEGIVCSAEPKEKSDSAPPPPGTRYEAPAPGDVLPEGSVFKVKLASGSTSVMLEVRAPIDTDQLVDAKVRLQGLCFNLHNRSRQFVKPFVQMPSGVTPEIVAPPSSNPFSEQPLPIASLFRFGVERGTDGHRVHVRGVVVHHQPGSFLWLRDGEHCLRVETQQVADLRPGDEVDVLGYPRPGEYSPILEDAVFRTYASGAPPEAVLLADMPGALRNDANLVQLDAELTEVRRFPESVELTLEWLGTPVRANLQVPVGRRLATNWEPGSRVRVQGICRVQTDDPGPLGGLWVPRRFELLLRSVNDLAVIQPPPWWTAERIVWLLSGFLLLALGVILVIAQSSRLRLKEQMQRRSMAEAEFSAILKERNRLAREIHDTLSQSLGAISVQLELARTHADELREEIRGYLGTAHKLTRAALAEARVSIWNMRSQVLELGDLSEALSRILKQTTDDTNVKAVVNVEGERRRLSPMVENNLLRIGQEAINNAHKHARPSRIVVTVTYEKRWVHLSVEDDGIGFEESAQPAGERRSFGILGIRERTDLLGGTVDISSTPGKGTRIAVSVPV